MQEKHNVIILYLVYRLLNPDLEINLCGLELKAKYSVQLRFVSSDQYLYIYQTQTKQWEINPYSSIQKEHQQMTCHPDSPNTGKFWMSESKGSVSVKLIFLLLITYSLITYRLHFNLVANITWRCPCVGEWFFQDFPLLI